MVYPFDDILSQAAKRLGASFADDDVFIMASGSYTQMFQFARPIDIRVSEQSKIMKHPLEDGSTIADHHVIEPIRIEMRLIFINDYRDVYSQMRSAFIQGQLLTVQTRARAYENMVISDLPHQESTDFVDVLMVDLRLEEALFITAEYGAMVPAQVRKSSDASTVNRGTQTSSTTNAAAENKTRRSYLSSLTGIK